MRFWTIRQLIDAAPTAFSACTPVTKLGGKDSNKARLLVYLQKVGREQVPDIAAHFGMSHSYIYTLLLSMRKAGTVIKSPASHFADNIGGGQAGYYTVAPVIESEEEPCEE